MKGSALLFCCILLTGLSSLAALSTSERAAVDQISADSMRGNLSFLASDALEGRATPSRGLDVAAEFIAAQFRRAGLEPIEKDGSYFQTAKLTEVTPNLEGLQLTLKTGGEELELKSNDLRVRSLAALELTDAPVIELPEEGDLPSIEGKVVAGAAGKYGNEAALARLRAGKPALILLVGRRGSPNNERPYLEEKSSAPVPMIRLASADAAEILAAKKPLIVSVHIPVPKTKDALAHNVGAVLRGSDPALRDQYVFLTAHYDHLGMSSSPTGDRVYNGANDNGSGTVSVIEIASALASLPLHPRRSIVFMAWYGEEEGLLGAFYYTHHPLVPLKDIVANINLEQMGRTDELDGPEVGAFAFTGPSYSDLPEMMTAAAKLENVSIYTKKNADAFFNRSDNYAFALAGIVAHTAVVAFEYPDYHGLADEWQKIDFVNMAKVDRGVAAGVLEIADAPEPPKWSDVKQTVPYRRAVK
ncbi:MAG: hypothetical protein QOJ99_2797 [Bryobacterales bacterium]|nr:hypothetical protein [Bryobacterales bacterium]